MSDEKSNTGYRNTGDRNTGDWNTGDRNTGDWNTGDRNTGDRNTGDWNTGYWNTGDRNTGYFNTTTPTTIRCFNKDIDRSVWDNIDKPDWLFSPQTVEWVPEKMMSTQEKIDHETFHTCGGYLKTNDMQSEWRKAFEGASEEDIQKVRDLPNFDNDVFKEITGLDLSIKAYCNGKTVEIDGVKYELKKV